MVLKLLLVPEVSVDDGADVGGPVGESSHDGRPVQKAHVKHTKPVLAYRPVNVVQPLHQLGHLGCLPRPVTALKHYQGSSLDG